MISDNQSNAESIDSLSQLSNTLTAAGQPEEALAVSRKAANLAPDDQQVLLNLVVALGHLGSLLFYESKFDRARQYLEEALTIHPEFAEGHAVLGNCLLNQADIYGALRAFQASHEISAFNDAVFSSYLFYMAFHPGFDAAQLSAENCKWGQSVMATVERYSHPEPENKPRLKIGYLSYEFGAHVTSYFFEPVIRRHDPARFETYVYAGNQKTDQTTDRLRDLADHWRNIAELAPDAAARAIYDDGIDILVLVSSYRAKHRLPFAFKAAPIQVCYHNLVSTTGLATMDYMVTEELTDPSGEADKYYSEKLVRITNRNCYQPPEDCPNVAPPPAIKNGYITFGTFNNVGKITPDAVEVWATILTALPSSRLVIKNIVLGDDQDWNPLRDKLRKAGINLDRVEFLASIPRRVDHLAAYHRIDIALDTFPCNGGTTSCDALWMGVPVVTLKGNTFMGRQSSNYLTKIGLPDLIVENPTQYCEAAVKLAGDLDRLVSLRQTIRTTMRQNLLDYDGHVTELEAAYHHMWSEYVAKEFPEAFNVKADKIFLPE